MATPMFIVTGFLDSGKTTMIKDTLMEQEWIEPGLTLLLLCEEGEEEYPEEYLKEKNMAAKKEIRSDNTYMISTDSTDNPKLGAKILSDGRESLFLDYYLGYNMVYNLSLIHI